MMNLTWHIFIWSGRSILPLVHTSICDSPKAIHYIYVSNLPDVLVFRLAACRKAPPFSLPSTIQCVWRSEYLLTLHCLSLVWVVWCSSGVGSQIYLNIYIWLRKCRKVTRGFHIGWPHPKGRDCQKADKSGWGGLAIPFVHFSRNWELTCHNYEYCNQSKASKSSWLSFITNYFLLLPCQLKSKLNGGQSKVDIHRPVGLAKSRHVSTRGVGVKISQNFVNIIYGSPYKYTRDNMLLHLLANV